MTVKNDLLGGTDWIDGDVLYAADLNGTLNNTIRRTVPVGGVIDWLKTFNTKSSGTADTDTTDKLVDSGATFSSDGVTVGMIIYNSTDETFAIVSAVDSETSLSLSADTATGSSTTDVFPDGDEDYVIYSTPELFEGWVECNGQTLSDADSEYNGAVLPDLNGNIQDFGTNSAIADTTLTDSTKSWATNEWDGYVVEIMSGAGIGQTREIASNTATALTFTDTGDWATSPGTSIKYQIHSGRSFIRSSYKSGSNGLGGGAWHRLTSDEMPTHTHTFQRGLTANDDNSKAVSAVDNRGNVTTASTGGDNIFDNKPPFYELVKIMRTK